MSSFSKSFKHFVTAGGWILSAALMLTACSLAQDVTPPPGVSVLQPNNSIPSNPIASASYPSGSPSSVRGAVIYAEHCAACHGPTGKGDGPNSAELTKQRGEPLPDFTAHIQHHTLADLFTTITQGRMEKFMPPWAQKLSESERWDVAAYLFNFSTTLEQLQAGEGLYAERCAACHGPTGNGDGPQAQSSVRFTDQSYMAVRSQADLLAALTNHTPVLTQTLSSEQNLAVMSFVRTLSFAAPGEGEPVAANVFTNIAASGMVNGRVSNGTAGASLPNNLSVVLHGFDNFAETFTRSATVQPDGQFAFAEVPVVAGRYYMLNTEYAGLGYNTDIFNLDSTKQVTGLALTIYETSPEATALRFERAHISLDFSGGTVNVAEVLLVSNLSDKTYAPMPGAALVVPLPEGASGVTVQNYREGEDYARTANGLAFNVPLRPGLNAAQFTLTFQLPAATPLQFQQSFVYPVAALNVLLADTSLSVSGANLQDDGLRNAQNANVWVYSTNNLPANNTVTFEVRANPVSAQAPINNWLWFAVGALSTSGLAGVGWWLYQRRRPAAVENADSLLQAIADLDDAFEAGELSAAQHRIQRARLKTKLLALKTAGFIENV